MDSLREFFSRLPSPAINPDACPLATFETYYKKAGSEIERSDLLRKKLETMNSLVVCGNATSRVESEEIVTCLVSGVSINHQPITQVSMRDTGP